MERNSNSGWSSSGGAADRPSSIETDRSGWMSKSPRRDPSQGAAGKGVGVMKSDNQSPATGGPTSCSPDQKWSYENGMNGVSLWRPGKSPGDTVGINWKVVSDDSEDQQSSCPMGTYSPEEEGMPIGPTGWDRQDAGGVDLDRASISSGERDSHGHSQSQDSYSNRPMTTSPATLGPHDSLSLGSSSGSNSRNEYQSSRNISGSNDGCVTGLDEIGILGGFEPPYSRVSPHNGAGTPIQGVRSGGVTPIQGGGGGGRMDGGPPSVGGDAGSYWGMTRGSVGSTSSVSSVGTNSSWKGDARNGGGFPGRCGSPRKMSR